MSTHFDLCLVHKMLRTGAVSMDSTDGLKGQRLFGCLDPIEKLVGAITCHYVWISLNVQYVWIEKPTPPRLYYTHKDWKAAHHKKGIAVCTKFGQIESCRSIGS